MIDFKQALPKHTNLIVCFMLVLCTLIAYGEVRNHDFLDYDDCLYVTENPQVRAGLTPKGVTGSFTATVAANWHPVTLLSHMLDVQLFGMDPGKHHLTNLFLHALNTILLYGVLRQMTGKLWQSAFVAALFALHPLHVESVAQVAQRKDVLSTLFWLLTLWGYTRYVRHPTLPRYLTTLLFFALGLLTKPMLVTLPFVLLLLDYWPLQRLRLRSKTPASATSQAASLPGLIRDKIPFFALTAASCVVTYLVQLKKGAVSPLDLYSLDVRIANALTSYVNYIGDMAWPSGLAFFYPHPDSVPAWQVAGACFLLVFLSFLAFRTMGKRPYFFVGWLWYVGTLVPVIGLVQVGSQARADRYAYVPLIGLYIAVVWGSSELAARWRYKRVGLAALAAVILILLTATTRLQVRHWAHSISLFEQALNVTEDNHLAHHNLGTVLTEKGRPAKALEHLREALRLKPSNAKTHNNMGDALLDLGKTPEAIQYYSEALRLDPGYAKAHNNLGIALANQGRLPEAIGHYNEAVRLNPGFALAHTNLGAALSDQGRIQEAIQHFSKALRIDPGQVLAHNNMGVALFRADRLEEAISHFKMAIRLKPDYTNARNNLQIVLAAQKRRATGQ